MSKTEELVNKLASKYAATPKTVAQSIKPLHAEHKTSMYAVVSRLDDETVRKLASMVTA